MPPASLLYRIQVIISLNQLLFPLNSTFSSNLQLFLPCIFCHNRDPDHWDEPDKFKPERFLDQEGRLVRHERFLPFGVGNDICLF